MQLSALYVLLGLTTAIAALCIVIGAAIWVLIDRTQNVRRIDVRLEVMENYLAQIVAETTGNYNEGEAGVFRSLDGKHVAGSIEDLMKKMAEDAKDSSETTTEVEKLKEFFTDATHEETTDWVDPGDDDDDDDDEPEPWQK